MKLYHPIHIDFEERHGQPAALFPYPKTGYKTQPALSIFSCRCYNEINIPLLALLQSNHDKSAIRKYCSFVEKMYYNGDEDVKTW